VLPIFSGTTEKQISDLVSKLRERLKTKFNIALTQSKLLHTVAEINGFRNWQSMKKTLGGPRGKYSWVLAIQSMDYWPATVIAPNLESALSGFMMMIDTAVRLSNKEVQWDLVGHDTDAAYAGIYLRGDGTIMASMTRAMQFSGVEGIDLKGADLSRLAGLCQLSIEGVGSEDDAKERVDQALNSHYALWMLRKTEDFLREYGSRDLLADNQEHQDLIESLRNADQYLEFLATISDGVA
jgi:hypothetical protein